MTAPVIEISGVLETVRFHNNSFLIGQLDSGTWVKGPMLKPQIGLQYTFRGNWQRHPTFGDQFSFKDFSTEYPSNLEGIRTYLREHTKWIGPAVSRQLLKTYGEKTLQTLKENPEQVSREISGITLERAMEISAMLRNNEADEKLQIALNTILGGSKVPKRAIQNILETWKGDAVAKIEENPYCLTQITGIGFLTADEIARNIKYDFHSPERIRAGLIHALQESAWSNGHVCLPRKMLVAAAKELLQLDSAEITAQIPDLIEKQVFVEAEDFIYTVGLYTSEQVVFEKLKMLVRHEHPVVTPDTEGLAEDQIKAITAVASSGVFVLTGAPGVGKTHTIKRILSTFKNLRIAMAAPTGKAAKRMMEQTGAQASTIHRLLEPLVQNGQFHFQRGADRPIEAELIVLDETSMIDTPLMASFLNAVAVGTRLILVGDTYQLPAVGPGNILKDIIASGQIPCVELDIIKRQSPGQIVNNCHAIKAGRMIELDNDSKDFFWIDGEDPAAIRKEILDLVARRLPESYHADPLKDIQVISPMREKTDLSCKAINEVFQNEYNKNPKVKNCRFKVGDKVIQLKNDYDKEIINGDIGYVQKIETVDRDPMIDVLFENPERKVTLPAYENNLDLAYAITCHKFQGSESKIIILPIHKCFSPLLMQRNWLYTAVSRAREVCICIGQDREIPKIIGRNKQMQRYTRLAKLLSGKD